METFTFLSDNREAVEAFVKETHHLTDGKSSHLNKIRLYQHYFPEIEARPKLTGFERISEVDAIIRARLRTGGDGWMEQGDITSTCSTNRSYLDIMIDYIQQTYPRDNLIFYSGGIDSEFVIKLFQLAGMPFTPITYVWKYGRYVINQEDVEYAVKYCKYWNLNQIIKTLNIEDFWNGQEIVHISQKIKDVSPQRCTYKKVSDLISLEHPLHNRIFAGEIRYRVKV